MNKMVKIVIALIALTAVFSFAQKGTQQKSASKSDGGFKLGFYGSLAGDNSIRTGSDQIGILFNLGNSLELGLGIGIRSASTTSETKPGDIKTEESDFRWEIIPSISYEIGKKDFVGYGAGLNIHFSSYSNSQTVSGQTVTTEPEGIDMGFFPNFFLKAELVKNFSVGLRTGLMINSPSDIKDVKPGAPDPNTGLPTQITKTTSKLIIYTHTELFVSFYL